MAQSSELRKQCEEFLDSLDKQDKKKFFKAMRHLMLSDKKWADEWRAEMEFQKEKALKFIEFLLGRYQQYGIKDFDRSLAPLIELSSLGNVKEIVSEFGGVENLKQSVDDLQREIYAR